MSNQKEMSWREGIKIGFEVSLKPQGRRKPGDNREEG